MNSVRSSIRLVKYGFYCGALETQTVNHLIDMIDLRKLARENMKGNPFSAMIIEQPTNRQIVAVYLNSC